MIQEKEKLFMQWYEPLHDRFTRFCRSRTYGDMPYQDLMQETILICFKKMDTIDKESFLGFMFGTAIRVLANHHRKKKHTQLPESFEIAATDHYTNAADHASELEWLHESLRQLPTEQREAIILFEISGFSTAEVAKIQRVSEAAVRQRLSRGRAALLTILEKRSSSQPNNLSV
jgi:RNA polymerase sigma-70 factor (ECF subfamily)